MSSTVQKCLQAMGQRVCLAAVVQSQHLKPKIELLVGILVYDTGFPFQSGDSREPGFESRRPHHNLALRARFRRILNAWYRTYRTHPGVREKPNGLYGTRYRTIHKLNKKRRYRFMA